MKIVHAIESINPGLGGPAAVATALALSQARLGHEITVAHYAERHHEDWAASLRVRFADLERVKFVDIPAGAPGERVLARGARRALRPLAAHADVIHVHGMWNAFNIAAARASLEQGSKLVITPHGMLDPWSLKQGRRKKALAMRLVWRALLNRAHFLHALNAVEAQLMSPLGLTAPVKVFPNGIFPEEFSQLPDAALFRRHCGLGSAQRYILFLGRLHYKKGVDFLIDAFERLVRSDSATHLVIAGPDDGLRSQVEQWIAQRHLEGRVSLVGPLYGELKMSALAGASCFCLPSRQEGFSMAILEAMAAGLPVVISEECHFPEVAQAGAGIVVPLEAAALGEALRELLVDEPRRAEAGTAAREFVLAHYTWGTIAGGLLAVYGD